jgi:hypothetical protein
MPTYRGAYSPDDPDFKKAGKNLASYPNKNPRIVGNAYGPPDGGPFNGAIDCSGTIDPQTPDRQGFDDGKGQGGFLKTKSDDGRGGFSGDLLPRGRGNNHPKYRR